MDSNLSAFVKEVVRLVKYTWFFLIIIICYCNMTPGFAAELNMSSAICSLYSYRDYFIPSRVSSGEGFAAERPAHQFYYCLLDGPASEK